MRLVCGVGWLLGSWNGVAYCVDSAWRRIFRNWQKDALRGGPQTLKMGFSVCFGRAWNHWPSGLIWFTDGGGYFWWHLAAAFSRWWTLGSGRRFPPGPNSLSRYWSSEQCTSIFRAAVQLGLWEKSDVGERGGFDGLWTIEFCLCDVLQKSVQPSKKTLFYYINLIIIAKNKHSLRFVLEICFYYELSSLNNMYAKQFMIKYKGMSFCPDIQRIRRLIKGKKKATQFC